MDTTFTLDARAADIANAWNHDHGHDHVHLGAAGARSALGAALVRNGVALPALRIVAETGSTNDDAAAWARAAGWSRDGRVVVKERRSRWRTRAWSS